MSVDVIGQNWYGTSVLESTLPLWRQWCKINEQVERFFNRCVGSRTALYYPVGRSVVGETAGGTPIEMDNAVLAKQTIAAMDQNFGIVLPQDVPLVVGEKGVRRKELADYKQSVLSGSILSVAATEITERHG